MCNVRDGPGRTRVRKSPVRGLPMLSAQRNEKGPSVAIVVRLTSSIPQLWAVGELKSPEELLTQSCIGERRSWQQSRRL